MKTVQTIQTTVTAQTVLASTLLRLSAADVEAAVKRELTKNPALELIEPSPLGKRVTVERSFRFEDTPRWNGARQRKPATISEGDDQDLFDRVAATQSASEQLCEQARLLVPMTDLDIVTCLIHTLDEHGFLRTAETDVARDLGVSPERIDQGIAWLQKLDPPGIGARDMRECFLLQCAHLTAMGVDCSLIFQILHSAWDCFIEQRWECVAKRARVPRTQIDSILQFMRGNLYPYPLLLVTGSPQHGLALTRPDLIVRWNPHAGGPKFSVQVVAAEMYNLQISATYRLSVETCAEGGARLAPTEREWVCQAIENARRFIDAVGQRWTTLRRVGGFVVAFQNDFFEHGPAHLKPLTRAAVAAALGVHESTVSRAVSDKVLQLPNGRLIQFSDLFDGSLAAKETIRQLIQTSGRSLSDREIAVHLQGQSPGIARRTVTKYRAQLGIPTKGHRQRARGDR